MPLGLYLSVPFCRTKCTYCNFASDVFSKVIFDRYVDRLCHDLNQAEETASRMGGCFDRAVDSIYLGGGTPTLLDITQLQRIFVTISQNFQVLSQAEITVECAPGTLNSAMMEVLQNCQVNRVSLGVQSFVDEEAASVGRLHRRETVLADLVRLRGAGITNFSIDLIAGLPHQTRASWDFSLNELIAASPPHVSVYMLEVDEDSRLGRELIAGGARYHAHMVPDEDLTAELYSVACERLEAAGLHQYEISNFARPGFESRHNLKYWNREPYLGFGVDAHSMLPTTTGGVEAVRFSTSDSLEAYISESDVHRTLVDRRAALEETFFLGLRLTRGVDLQEVSARFGQKAVAEFSSVIAELVSIGLLQQLGSVICLTAQGRLLSNEVFEKFIAQAEPSRL